MAAAMMLAVLVLDPIRYDSNRLWMLIPLTAAVAVVYKTLKLSDLRQVPVAALLLWLAILGGMVLIGAGIGVVVWFFV